MDHVALTIVIPAYNEAETLPKLLPGLLSHCVEQGWQLLVVNDGSKDDTRTVLGRFENHPALTVVHHKVNRGYGGAMKSGLAQAHTPYVVTIDADGQHQVSDIQCLLSEMLLRDADMVIGARVPNGQANWYRELGKWLIRRVTKVLMPLHIHDLNSGFKLYRTELVQGYMHSAPDTMAFSDIITLIFISEARLVCETAITVQPRAGGRSTINTMTAIKTLGAIFHIVTYVHPMRIFLPVAFLAILLGVAWGTPIILAGRGVSVGSMLSIMIGVILLFLGLVAEQLTQIRKEIVRLRFERKGNLPFEP